MRRFMFFSPSFVGARCASTLNSCGIIGETTVKSVSNWKWSPFCQQFAETVHAPTLCIPTGARLCPSAAVFARLAIDDNLLLNPPKDKQVFDHCKIEKVMNSMGHRIGVDPYSKVLDDNRRMVDQLADARQEEMSETRYEKTIDQCAEHFLQLCGFDDSPFKITAEGAKFKIFGKICHSDGDHYVVVTPDKDLVLVFEDKSLKQGQVLEKQGHLGQIVGELLQMLSLNRDKKKFGNVFAVRFVNYHVTAFRVAAGKTMLNTLCDTEEVPKRKLKLLCTEPNPATGLGLSLIDPKERLKALQIMADIRRFILVSRK